MIRTLVIYGTIDGYTRKVAYRLAMMLRVYDVDVDVARAGGADVVLEDYSGIIVGASVHRGHYQRPVAQWVRAHAAALADKRTAFVSVCLGVLHEYTDWADQQAFVDEFVRLVAPVQRAARVSGR